MTGFAPQDSWRKRACSGRRAILILMGLLAVVTLTIVAFGFVGRKYTTALGKMEEDVKGINRTITTELANLQQKEVSNLKTLQKVNQMVQNLSEETKEVKSQLQDQITKVQVTLQKLNCDLEDIKHNQTGSPRGCCPRGWHFHDHSCYWVSNVQKSWNEAKEDCEGKNAHLVTLTSYLERQFVSRLTKPLSAWIGLKYNGETWKWVDGTPYTVRRVDWRVGEPNINASLCTVLYLDGQWIDQFCKARLRWVCEMRTLQ